MGLAPVKMPMVRKYKDEWSNESFITPGTSGTTYCGSSGRSGYDGTSGKSGRIEYQFSKHINKTKPMTPNIQIPSSYDSIPDYMCKEPSWNEKLIYGIAIISATLGLLLLYCLR